MKAVIIYHEAVSKLVFMKTSFISKIIVNRQTFSLFIDLIVYRQNYSLLPKLMPLSNYCRVLSKSSFTMETILTSRSTWIVETMSRVWEAMKVKVKKVANSLV